MGRLRSQGDAWRRPPGDGGRRAAARSCAPVLLHNGGHGPLAAALAARPQVGSGPRGAGVAIAEIQRWTARHGVQPARPGGQTGSVTVIQRFGGALNLNLHFHILVLDGQYAADPRTGALRWYRARPPTTEEVERLVERVADRAEAWLARRGFRGDEGLEQDPDDVQAAIQAAAVMGRSVLRRGRRARRVQVLGGRPHALPPRCATADGYTVHAGVVIGAKNREGLERLCRYIARPPLAKGRLEENPDGTLRLHLKRPWSDGTVAFTFSAAEFVERLAALIPPPHKNQVIYHGVLAPRAAWRQQVVPRPLRITDAQRKRRVADVLTRTPSRADRPRWTPWRQLLERTFGADGFGCPNCFQRMRLRAVVMPPATLRVIEGLQAASRAPPGERVAG